MKPAARRPLLLCALAAAAALSFLLVAPPPPLAAHLSSLLLAFPASPYAGRPKLLFLLAGQSNMAGRGLAPHPLPAPFRPHPRVLRLAASRRWVVAAPPLHADIDTHKVCGLGPAMPFAHRLLEDAGSGESSLVLGFVPAAVGGTRIWMWRLVNDFRADLGIPDLLVIQVGLASGEGNYTDIVREGQKNIKLPNVILVDAIGLPLQDDQLHLSTEAQLWLGDMLGQAYLKFNSSTDSRQ
ncbi:hypothetical protein PVAP13_7NG108600 [Panicum virgatum]|uniref:Sialate O-acetylesterase domain-containing protein n=1 Tax=Panicum virgatum TaxID=38727 RepID=A0A8T0PV18_PANVG|nr:hypothetical protein PVAP13_7NG108600 [Panicum virgatum]